MATSVGPTVYRGDSAPATGRIGDIWVDTSTGFPILNFCTDPTPTWIAAGGMRPIKTTKYTSGSGTHTFASAGQWCRITLQAGGGGGGMYTSTTYYAHGGGAGEYLQLFVYIPNASLAYGVGAGGTGRTGSNGNGTDGGNTYLGHYHATGGQKGYGGTISTTFSQGGGSTFTSYVDAIGADVFDIHTKIASIPGGAGGRQGEHGRPFGMPVVGQSMAQVATGYAGVNASNAGGGGSSVMGKGGDGGNGVAGSPGTGYGAGGGGCYNSSAGAGDGTGGILIIEEFGAW